MANALFRFYEELNDFLPAEKRKRDFSLQFSEGASIGDMLRLLGVPLTEVDLVLVNGRSANFEYRLEEGDRISVFPVFESLDIGSVTRLSERPLRKVRFIAEPGLEELARFLQSRGFDVRFDPALTMDQVIEISKKQKRILISRNNDVGDLEGVKRVVFAGTGQVYRQAKRILMRLGIESDLD